MAGMKADKETLKAPSNHERQRHSRLVKQRGMSIQNLQKEGPIMRKNHLPEGAGQPANTSGFSKRIGSVVYEVTIHFNQDAKETMNDKILRLVKNEAHSGKAAAK